jgi:hypothetical protein
MLAWLDHTPGLATWSGSGIAGAILIFTVVKSIIGYRQRRKKSHIQERRNLQDAYNVCFPIFSKINEIYKFLYELQHIAQNIDLKHFKIINLEILEFQIKNLEGYNKNILTTLKKFYSSLSDYERQLNNIIDETEPKKYLNENKRKFEISDKQLLQEKINTCQICANKLILEFRNPE